MTCIDKKFLILASSALLIAGCGSGQDEAARPATSAAPAPITAAAAPTSIGTEIDDTVVTTKVKAALLADPDISGLDLKVETRKGTVQLSGFVDNQAQIDRAVEATRKVEGVSGVESGMSVKEGSPTLGNAVDDGVITTEVKSALLADPDIKSFDIAVVTRMGEVQLSGFVDSQSQINQAVEIARRVNGVTSVGNELSVKQ